MSRYIKSVTESKKFLEAVDQLKDQVKYQRLETHKNNQHLAKINELAQTVQEEKIVKLEQEIQKIKEDSKWVDTSAKPAIDHSNDHLLKKLNIL